MTCERFENLAELLVLGELQPDQAAAAEAHLAECAACRQAFAAARRRLCALANALCQHRMAEDFAERTMARVRAEAAPAQAEPERPEPMRSRLFRYAALAAAAALLAMAGYGLLRPRSGAWLESGTVAVVGPGSRMLRPNEPLVPGQELATPPGGTATLALAGGRLRVAMGPQSRVRILDPRTGTAVRVLQGEAYCRGSDAAGTPMVASPLANVAAGSGVVSLHVSPEPAGSVIVAALDRGARVAVAGQQGPTVPLERGQVLTLSAERPGSLSLPIPIERLRRALEAEARATMARHGELEVKWHALLRGLAEGGERMPLGRMASDLQEALGQTRALHGELTRRLSLLDRWEAEGQRAFRLVLQPSRGTK